MTGYQETLTDPSYHRQVVVQTAPHIGNTGVNDEDDESDRIWVAGYVVRDPARTASNWRATGAWRTGWPPRGCRHQRHRHPGADPAPARARGDAGRCVQRGRAIRRRCWSGCGVAADGRRRPVGRGDHAAAVRRRRRGRAPVHGRRARPGHQAQRRRGGWPPAASPPTCCRPSSTTRRPARRRRRTRCSSRPARATRPPPTTPVGLAREVLRRRIPLFGICFGSQILGRALGFGTYKLGYGHRGINQPVLDRATGKVEVTSPQPRLRGRLAGPRRRAQCASMRPLDGQS